MYEFDGAKVNSRGVVTRYKNKDFSSYYSEDINGVSLEMVEIHPGTFLMGSPDNEAQRHSSEGPQHTVSVPSFFMGKYEITQAQWQAVASLPRFNRDLHPNPSQFKSDNLPVERVTWEDAVEFCERLSRATGRKYRLPSEAEWEYACRAGTITPFAFGATITPELVNYDGNYPYGRAMKGRYYGKTTPVGEMGAANAFGLYDMHGNVWEWCQDNYHQNYIGAPSDGSVWVGGETEIRVLRGGSWFYEGQYCRSALRVGNATDYLFNGVGFRVVLGERIR
jgi:formylglycine-generating enzyme required for sulfatase activity